MGVVARDYQLQIADSPRFFVCVYLNQERAITEYAENPIQSRLRIIIAKMKTASEYKLVNFRILAEALI